MADVWDDYLSLPRRWSLTWHWHGWRRCLWLAVQVDFKFKAAGVVILGLEISYAKRIAADSNYMTRPGVADG